jgi:stearoyl-CoA desaturase (delta-9 desaturase)
MSQSPAKPPLIKTNVVVFVALPLAALLLVPAWGVYHGYDAFQWLWALAFLYLNGLSITGGYHRLWAHRTFEASPALKWFFALWGAGALQNSILIWASDHRRHHRHVDDNEKDPYSAGRGLWFSHMGWMLREYDTNEKDFANAQDLQRDPVVMWQDRHYVALTTFMNLGLPLALGFWHGDIIGTVLLVGLLRLVVNHHFTFFINSLAGLTDLRRGLPQLPSHLSNRLSQRYPLVAVGSDQVDDQPVLPGRPGQQPEPGSGLQNSTGHPGHAVRPGAQHHGTGRDQ